MTLRCALFAMALLLPFGSVAAHEGRPLYVEISETAMGNYSLKWKTPPVISRGQEPNLSLVAKDCVLVDPTIARGLTGAVQYRCVIKPAHLALVVTYPSANPALSTLVLFSSIDQNPKQIFSGPDISRIALLEDRNFGVVVLEYLDAGIRHILGGIDHLLFVFCLIVIAGNVRRLILVITGFTVAHSLTLALAVMDVIRLPAHIVEPLIILSILLLAAEIIRSNAHPPNRADTLTWRYPVLSSSIFGFLHGFGFASVLTELGLPGQLKVVALLFFNLGVEAGQLLFVSGVLAAGFVVLRQKNLTAMSNHKVVAYLVYTVGICSAYWLWEQVA